MTIDELRTLLAELPESVADAPVYLDSPNDERFEVGDLVLTIGGPRPSMPGAPETPPRIFLVLVGR